MPELPEVETMCQKLRGWAVGKTIWEVEVLRGKRYLPDQEREQVRSARIENVWRRGKLILFETTRGTLVCHNAMSGYWDLDSEPWTFDYVEGHRDPTDRDVRVKIKLESSMVDVGPMSVLRFHDARLFGSLKFHPGLPPEQLLQVKNMGPEIIPTPCLVRDFTLMVDSSGLHEVLGGCTKAIKEGLMDQERIAGIGNIYASEILWNAKIDPRHDAKRVVNSEENRENIFAAAGEVLRSALSRNLDYSGLNIYRRKTCPLCSGPVSKIKMGGRSTYFCDNCQN